MKSISLAAGKHLLKYAVRVVEAILLVTVLAVAVLAWRLSQGPLSLDRSAPYIESALAELTPGYAFDVGHVSLSWRESGSRPSLEVSEVSLLRTTGEPVAALEAMDIRLDISSLLRGTIAVDHIGLFKPVVRLTRRANGEITVGLASTTSTATPATASDTTPASSSWMDGVLASRADGPRGAALLDTIEIRDFTLIVDDQARGRQWVVPEAQLQVLRQESDIQLGASLPLSGGGGAAMLDLAGRYVYATRAMGVTATFTEVRPDALAELLGITGAEGFGLPIQGTVEAELALTTAVPTISLLKFDLKAGAGTITLPERLGGATEIAGIDVRGTSTADFNDVTLENVTIRPAGIDGDPVITLTGRAGGLKSVPAIDLEAAIPTLSLKALTTLWPEGIKRNTRGWIERNLEGGSITGLTAKAVLGGPSVDEIDATSLDLQADLNNLRVNYITGMPRIEGTTGRLKLDLRALVIDVSKGHVPDPVSGAGLSIRRGDLRFGDLSADKQDADFTIDIDGSLGDVLRFIDHPPLGYAKAMNVKSEGASGSAKVKLKLQFPLISALRLADLKIDVNADVEKGHIENVTFGLPLDDATLNLHVTDKQLDAKGTAKLGPIRSGLTWHENFGGGEFRSQYALDAIIENEHRPLIALGRAPFTAPYMDGPVRTEVVYTTQRDGTATLVAEADLTNMNMAVPELQWSKPAGRVARGQAEVLLRDGALDQVRKFTIIGGDDLSVEGRVEFGPQNALSRVSVSESRIGRTRLAADLVYTPEGVMDLEVRGREFDAGYFWKDLGKDESRGRASGDAGKEELPINLRAVFDRMWLSNEAGGEFQQVRLVFERDKKAIQKIDLSGRVPSGAPFTLVLANEGDGRKFEGSSADAGDFIRALGLFDDMQGGTIDLKGSISPVGVVDGIAEISDFKLREAPLVARVLSVAALTGIVDALRGDGISFSTLRVPFAYSGSTLQLKEAEMYGSSLGMTMSGNYTFGSAVIDIEGTLVPAYAINSMFNFIPLVGDILSGGEKGSGIFAATYRWQGPTATTTPSVNPLAALAPGILRKFFSIFQSSPAKVPPPAAENPPAPPPAELAPVAPVAPVAPS